jgi:hypothetical protein
MVMWYVRTFFREGGELVYLDEGPWDRYLAELVIADIGVDGSIPRGLERVRVERAILVAA